MATPKRCPLWKPKDLENRQKLARDLGEAVKLITDNEVVGFPTETVYGLGGNAFSDTAISKIFSAKGRPSNNPLIVHVASKEQVLTLVDRIPTTASKLMDKFWPGPLTIVMKTKSGGQNKLSKLCTCGLQTVGVRMPAHPVALSFIAECGLPIAAPSANKSGKPSPTTAAHVLGDLGQDIAGVIDGGETGIGLESTVVEVSEGKDPGSGHVTILRPGGVTIEMLRSVVGSENVSVDPGLNGDETKLKPKSPGMLYTHYAPNAPMWLVKGSKNFFQKMVNSSRKEGKKVGVLVMEDGKIEADHVEVLAKDQSDLKTASHNLYASLRAFDSTDVDIIFAPLLSQEGIGVALVNRMVKAAGKRVVHEGGDSNASR